MARVEEELRARWSAVLGSGHDATVALDGLLGRYREPQRHYHTLAHLLRALRDVDALLDNVEVPDADAVRLAAWFHDAIYDPMAANNEEASAALAARALAELGQPAERQDAVVRLVLATATHEPTLDDEAVLIDADLAVLGADSATYSAYARGVRREYEHVDESAWRDGRAAVLRAFLERPAIFHTAPMARLEARARANLTAELAGLDASVSRSPERVRSAAVNDAPDTVVEALAQLRAEGYRTDVAIRNGHLHCGGCEVAAPIEGMVADRVFRFEGMSNPDDEAIVIGVTCPGCGARGALVSAYGPSADPDELAGIRMIAERYAGQS
jgi:predicted metal-dependent HD superfamily phosphohydrolase